MWANFETRCFYRIGAAGMAALEYEGGGVYSVHWLKINPVKVSRPLIVADSSVGGFALP